MEDGERFLLVAPLSRVRSGGNPWRLRNRRAKIYSLLTEHKELIDEVLIRDTPVKALIGTGASISLLNAKFFQQAKMNRRLKRSDLE